MTTPIGKRTPAFQFYPSDFLGSSKVQRMSLTERGAYITLLSFCWLDNGLPTDTKTLAAMLHVKAIQFDRMWSGALHECFYEKNGRLHNPRLDAERKKQAEFSKLQRDRISRRWDKARNTKSGNTAVVPEPYTNGRNTLQSPSPSPTPSPNLSKTRTGSLIQRRRLDAAWEGARVWVPNRTHADFLGFRNGNEEELLEWYAEVDNGYSGEIDPEMFDFWRARYKEKWPPADKPKPSNKPEWLRRAVQS